MNTIEVRAVAKSFGNVEVLKRVDLSIPQGKVFALLGSNGAGKTTLVKIISTLLQADQGDVIVNGFNTTSEPRLVRNSLSLTGQFAATDGMLTGSENLELIAKLRGVSDSQQTAIELLNRFGLTDAGDRRAATYSGGMQRRLDIAMSLVGDPEIVILDEPTTGLDPQSRRQMWGSIRELANTGTTILLTTQYLDEAEELADRIAILHEGRIIQEGTLSELQAMMPAPVVERVVKKASLEDILLSITSTSPMTDLEHEGAEQ